MRRGIVGGRVSATNAVPQVIRLNDCGKRKVVLRFNIDALQIDLELKEPELVQREIMRAEIWASGEGER